MKTIIIIFLSFCLVGCVNFELKESRCGFEEPYITPCVILTSSDFWVDRVELGELIEVEGGTIQRCDWSKVIWTVEGDIQEHIKKIRPKIRRWALKNKIF